MELAEKVSATLYWVTDLVPKKKKKKKKIKACSCFIALIYLVIKSFAYEARQLHGYLILL